MYLTRGINEKMASDLDFSKFIINSMKRFNSRDWGDLCEEDKAMNDYAMKHDNCRIVARYNHINEVDDIYVMAWSETGKVQVEILFCSEY